MGRPLQTLDNIEAPDSDFEFGRVKDNDGTNNGTRLNESTMGDIFTFFAKCFNDARVTPNSLPDSDYSGYQFFEAVMALPYRRYECLLTQSSTSAPSVSEMPWNNQKGTIVWTRSGVGDYRGTISTQYPTFSTQVISGVNGFAIVDQFASNVMRVRTFNTGGAASDGILNTTSLVLHLYND